MSKSLKRVIAEAERLGLDVDVVKMDVSTKTAQEAATAIGADVDQIAKSVIFRGARTDNPVLFLTAGSNRVDPGGAARAAGEDLLKADAAFIRDTTGFAIGGVSPIGHINPIQAFWDVKLDRFATIWAAAGTPHHMFEIAPTLLRQAINAQPARFTATGA